MGKITKRILVCLFGAIMIACATVLLFSADKKQVLAETKTYEVPTEFIQAEQDSGFEVEEGASVRISTEAIKFTSAVTKGYYDLITSDGGEVTFFAAVKAVNGKKVMTLPFVNQPMFEESDEDSKTHYLCAYLNFDNVSEAILNQALSTHFETSTYAVVEKEGVETYYKAYSPKRNDRSMRAVANSAYLNYTENDGYDKEDLVKYFEEASRSEDILGYTIEGDTLIFSMPSHSKNAKDGQTYIVYINAKPYEATFSAKNGKYKLKLKDKEFDRDDDKYISIFDDDDKVHSGKISNSAEKREDFIFAPIKYGEEYRLVGYVGEGNTLTSLNVPSTHNDKPITEISYGVFAECTSLEEITLPFVGASSRGSKDSHFGYVFGASDYLASDKIPASLSKVVITGGDNIGDSAFRYCASLTSMVIPNSVISIGSSAFSGCKSLVGIEISDCVISIGDYAFYNCSSLTSIEMPSSVTSIGDGVFSNCSSLTNVTMSESVTSIDSFTFSGCSSLANIEIPNNVTSIGDDAFSWCASLTSIVIPNSVASIGSSAFSGCKSLVGIEISGCVISIGRAAFSGCASIKSIVIPNSVTSIGDSAFHYCSSLTSIVVGESNLNYESIDGNLYRKDSKDGKTLIQYAIGKTEKNFVVPVGVTSIGDYAFRDCSSLTSIEIPNSVTSIGKYAFDYCSSLLSIEIPDSVTSIGDYAFYNCSLLESVEIGNGLTSIGDYAFYNCSSLTSIVIPNRVTSIGYSALDGCTSLTSITLPFIGATSDRISHFGYIFGATRYSNNNNYVPTSLKTVVITGGTSIGNSAFYNCSSLTSIVIPSSVTSIGNSAFYNCSSLTSIEIPNSVTSIGRAAFSGCTSLTSATLPFIGETKEGDTNTHFGYIFGASDYSLNSRRIPNSLKTVVITGGNSIGDYAFYDCDSLISIEILNSITSIGSNAFSSCTSLTSVTMSESVTSIGVRAFSGCASLANVVISNSVTSIEDYAFYNCSSLTSIVIPNRVTSIGSDVFYNCSLLESVKIGNNVTSIGNSAFSNCSSLTSIEIPNSVTSIGGHAFYNCGSLTSIEIPNSVTSIGDYAFYKCNSLVSITLPFVGEAKDGTSNTHFGYIFGANMYSYNKSYVPASLKTVVITGGAKISEYAFSNCSSLTSMEIPNSVTSIGGYAFYDCDSLTSIEIPNSVTSIGWYAFYNCGSLTSIEIPNSVTSIGRAAFSNCSSLVSIEIPDSVTSIGDSAFYKCNSLVSITLPFVGEAKEGDTNTHFGYIFGASSYLYNGDYVPTSLKTVVITGGTSIGNSAFYNCSSLTSIVIPSSVTSIGNSAFNNCSSLTSIVIPNSVTSIGSGAFLSCSKLEAIYCEAESKPSGWKSSWKGNSPAQVVWGYKG